MRSLKNVFTSLALTKRAENNEVLAIAAHYDRSRDRFLIATGVSSPLEDAAVTLWIAAEGSTAPWWSFNFGRWLPGSEFCAVRLLQRRDGIHTQYRL